MKNKIFKIYLANLFFLLFYFELSPKSNIWLKGDSTLHVYTSTQLRIDLQNQSIKSETNVNHVFHEAVQQKTIHSH